MRIKYLVLGFETTTIEHESSSITTRPVESFFVV